MSLLFQETKSERMGGQRERFVRFHNDSDSRMSSPMEKNKLKKHGCYLDNNDSTSSSMSSSLKRGLEKGSQGLKNIGRSLKIGVSRVVFPEDLKPTDRMIFDPQDKNLQRWNRFFVLTCIIAVAVDPLFFYVPVFDDTLKCLDLHKKLAITTTVLRSITDLFYLIHMALQFRTGFIAPSSRVFGRGELVIDPLQIAKRYLSTYFIIDFLAVLPLPQVVIWMADQRRPTGLYELVSKNALQLVVFFQYIPRFFRLYPLISDVVKTSGVFAETAWAGAAYNLLLYMLASHVFGAWWYLLAVEREDSCWQKSCSPDIGCRREYLYCTNYNTLNFSQWNTTSNNIFHNLCPVNGDNLPFNFGIYASALSMRIVASKKFFQKYFYCLWWGLQNLSTLGQGLQTSKFIGEVIFSITLAVFGLILFALLIGNMQTYLQSLTVRLEEMRIKRRDTEQWMRHRLLPDHLRQRVRRYDQYKWLETRGVDEESLVQSLPKDLRRDIKRHLCLGLVRRVPLFENVDDRLIDALCERLKPTLFTEDTYIVREGDPVDEMLFIIRGHLDSITTNGGRTGFFNRGLLKQGDFCGEELLTWALDPRAGANLPSSTRTVKALSEVEAFALRAEDLKFVASQFRRLHSRQVQHTFRFYSHQWRTWAACFIQAAWRRHCKRRRHALQMQALTAAASPTAAAAVAPSFGAALYVSRFAANALRGVHRMRNMKLAEVDSSIKLQKPSEPDFTADPDDDD